MSDPVKEAVARLTDDLSRAREDDLVLTDAPNLRALLAENARLTKLVEEAGEALPIETAVRDEAAPDILASTNGKVWFQCSWSEEDQEWVTFNRYLESDARVMSDKRWVPTLWIPIPRAAITHKAIKGGGE